MLRCPVLVILDVLPILVEMVDRVTTQPNLVLYGRIPHHRIYSMVGYKLPGMVGIRVKHPYFTYTDSKRATDIVIATKSGAVLHDRLLSAIIGSATSSN